MHHLWVAWILQEKEPLSTVIQSFENWTYILFNKLYYVYIDPFKDNYHVGFCDCMNLQL